MSARVDRDSVTALFNRVRRATEELAAPLSAEDMLVQSMPDASPTKWHLGHTTWFFEEFVLARFDPAHKFHDTRWRVLFNSYYRSVGPRHPRASRGVLSRPSLEQVRAWRSSIDAQMNDLLARADDETLSIVLLGAHHEQQHQELILTDVKHALSCNELRPAYRPLPERLSRPVFEAALRFAEAPETPRSLAPSDSPPRSRATPDPAPRSRPRVDTPPWSFGAVDRAAPLKWTSFDQRVIVAGHDGEGFAFDNERPQHRAIVGPFEIASRLVTNAEYLRFLDDGGYQREELWLSDGWAAAQAQGWTSPLYWEHTEGIWKRFGFHGVAKLDLEAPVSHVSFYEADAYARWAQARLPTEYEWETAVIARPIEGNFVESGLLDPAAAAPGASQLFGDTWEWTASAYAAYPRFHPLQGALGEYNAKFMSGQMVLRGGSCLSPRDHIRPTYRNFFPPSARWQMNGVRLARDL
ncbi:MAG TPA: ergothioneine biosynthesis protein EgtB [Polyangiaceae bacterium]|nr:ergothioneine biosynthesis protein EgtB [Polyangiaceae bacterium]